MLGLALGLATLFASVGPACDARASTTVARRLSAQDGVELRRLREVARRAKGADAEAAWERVARYALLRARSLDASPADPARDAPEVTSALREACARLPAPVLASVATAGAHPVVSAAFCRAIERDGGPAGVPAGAEIAAEALDALAAFGGVQGRELLDRVRRGEERAAGAGGAQHSVFRLWILGADPADSASTTFALGEGIRRGVRAAAGTWADRFEIRAFGWPEAPLVAILGGEEIARPGGPGVVVVASGEATAWAAIGGGLGAGIVVADARAPGELAAGSRWEQSHPRDEATLPERLEARSRMVDLDADSSLAYDPDRASRVPRSAVEQFLPLLLRPHSIERGRRLAEVLASRPEVRRIAIAIPSVDGDFDLAAGFLAGARELRREAAVLEYEPGRRDYAPEARHFAESGAQALLLAGPAEESAEWVAALARARLRPLVLGSNELDPAGFHAGVRAGLEGAIFAGDDWEDRDANLLARIHAAGDSLALGDDPGFRRGYRFAWMVTRSVVEGAWTPTSLRLALERRSLPRSPVHPFDTPVQSRAGAVNRPTDVVVPLFVVRNGEARPLEP